jgi:hypothetical protein
MERRKHFADVTVLLLHVTKLPESVYAPIFLLPFTLEAT